MVKFDEHILESKRYAELRKNEEENLVRALSKQYGYTYVNLNGVSINPEALILVSESTAHEAELVTFEKQNKLISVAIKNPNNEKTKTVLEELATKWKLSIYMCSAASLEHAWTRYADQKNTTATKKGVLDIDPAEIKKLSNIFKNSSQVKEKILEIKSINPARRVSATLEVIFAGALALKASDIHIEPEPSGARVRFRLDGVLHDVVLLERNVYERLMSRIKLLAGLILNIRNEAQDGRFTFDNGDKAVEVRTSVIPGSAGESAVMRLLDPSVASFSMDNLGLNPIMYEIMSQELKRPNGMILTTGPTGSGKTTALYAFLRQVHTPEIKIITIEDPVEYKVEGLVQTQVEEDYSFASGLRSVLRQDPDVIMVGEIRDRDVAETAVHAAETGHLVFSTLHTNSAAGAFPRLIDLGVDSRLIGSAANIIIGQRLVRKLCDKCKKPKVATPEEQDLIYKILENHPKPPAIKNPLTIYEASGCELCSGTGYNGRQGIFEAIKVDVAVEEAVIRDPREHVIMEAAKAQGIPTMQQDGIEKVLLGITSLDELRRVIDLNNIR